MSNYILPEIVTEILKRLPVKSLLRFRSVCKQWCILISDTSFVSQHIASSASSSRTLVQYYSRTYQKDIYTVYDHECIQENRTRISFPFHDVSRITYFRIVGYCHGLLCFYGKYNYVIVLWNPSIKRALTLPSPAYPYNSRSLSSGLGFGFCSVGNEVDYKVVKLDYPGRSHVFVTPKVEVFSLSSRVWKQIDNKVECRINDNVWSNAFIGGIVHWVAFKNTRGHQINVILKFDLSSEELCELDLPKDLASVAPLDVSATTVEGKLSVLHNCSLMEIGTGYLSSCEIWVMKEYNNVGSWTQLFKVKLKASVVRVMGVRRDGEIVLFEKSGELVIFDPKDDSVTETGIVCTDINELFFFDRYVESLLLLGKGEEVQGTETESDSEDVDASVEQAESVTVAFKTPENFLNNLEPE